MGLSVSVIGNLSIAGFFLSPLSGIMPRGFPADFGMIIFVLEFLNVHSSIVAHSVTKTGYHIQTTSGFLKQNPKLFLIGFYFLGALTLGMAMQSWVLPAYFAVGLISKFYGRRSAPVDDRVIIHLVFLLLFSFMLGMRLWVGILFFLFIWVMGLVYVAFPSFPLWRKYVERRMESLKKSNPSAVNPERQLFRDKLDFFQFSTPLIIFVPLYLLSWSGSAPLVGENFWPIIYFPSLAINDIAVFVRARFYPIS